MPAAVWPTRRSLGSPWLGGSESLHPGKAFYPPTPFRKPLSETLPLDPLVVGAGPVLASLELSCPTEKVGRLWEEQVGARLWGTGCVHGGAGVGGDGGPERKKPYAGGGGW